MNKKQSIIPGVVLITIGLLLLSAKIGRGFNPWEQALPVIIIIFALALIFETFRNHNDNALFWGVVLILLGAFYSLRNFNVIPFFYIDEYWPIFLISPGAGILIQNIVYGRKPGPFISSSIMILLGLFFLMFTLPYDFDIAEYYLSRFWPLMFVLLGLIIILKSLKNSNNEIEKETEQG
ncbi:hypothetical protein J7K93_14310 [bacterium]|nr:hypothetical protein [bacterium]